MASASARRLKQVAGDAIGAGRLAVGWSQREFARRAGVSQATVWKVERGAENLSLETLAAMCDALGLRAHLAFQPPFIAGDGASGTRPMPAGWPMCSAGSRPPAAARWRSATAARVGEQWRRRGVALIDPARRRRDWLIRSRVDGRRSPAPYADYATFMRSIGRR